jgi:hypothetical protein
MARTLPRETGRRFEAVLLRGDHKPAKRDEEGLAHSLSTTSQEGTTYQSPQIKFVTFPTFHDNQCVFPFKCHQLTQRDRLETTKARLNIRFPQRLYLPQQGNPDGRPSRLQYRLSPLLDLALRCEPLSKKHNDPDLAASPQSRIQSSSSQKQLVTDLAASEDAAPKGSHRIDKFEVSYGFNPLRIRSLSDRYQRHLFFSPFS